MKRLAKKVLLIGWDAADWKVINPLMDAGLMPTLNSLVNRGVIANLATLDPPLSPILWTSIATGKTADKHGILGFVEPDAETMTIRPVSSRSRKVKAIWNILTQKGFKTHVVGWWPSHPAEPINGIAVSNFYQKATGKLEDEWKMADGTVHPKTMEEIFAELRVHPGELTMNHILPFVPKALEVDQEKDKRLQVVANILAQCSSIHAASTWILENQDWDFVAVYHDAVDHYCHGFMKFHPPQQKGIPDDLFEKYKDVVAGAYRFHDMMLERLLDLAGKDVTVILMSDHGFHSDHLRPKRLPKEPAGPAYEHSPYGILCMAGESILEDERIYGATLLDIAPTLLTLFGLPIGGDMNGKPLVQAFKETVTPEYIPSWEEVEGEAGMLSSEMREDPWAAKEAMNQLIELGYIEKPDEDKEKALKNVTDESQYYLARVLVYMRQYEKALEVYENLALENPETVRYNLGLLGCYQTLNKTAQARALIDKLRKEGAELAQLDLIEAGIFMVENKPRKAMELLQKVENHAAHLPYFHIQLANSYQKLQKWKDAERTLLRALEIDPNNAQAHHGLCLCYLRSGLYEEAAEEALNAIGLLYHFPSAHFYLGEALFHLEEYERAVEAFSVCVSMSPGNRKAHLWLIKIYNDYLHLPEKAISHEQFIKEKIRNMVTVVTGLPRSGTSMIMQMLKAGGMEILTDNERKEDNNNPKGYLELEKVKKLATDKSWLNEADNKAVKIVVPLLMQLPVTAHYKIIFVHRDIGEVLRSQQIMLGKQAELRANAYPVMLANAFQKQLEKAEHWLKNQPHAEVLHRVYE